MMVFPSMLLSAAENVGMEIPPEETIDDSSWSVEKFPHWTCFCNLQLCRPMQPGEHWENAKVIVGIPVSELTTMTLQDFVAKGLHFQS